MTPGSDATKWQLFIDNSAATAAAAAANYAAYIAGQATENMGNNLAVEYENLTFPVTIGTYCWYLGSLYKAKVDIPTSEEWTVAHWT